MLLWSFSTESLDLLSYNTMKVRKILVRYVDLENMSFNTVEESGLKDMLREGLHPDF